MRRLRFDIDNSDSPSSVWISPLDDYAFVTLQGNKQVVIIDLIKGEIMSRIGVGAAAQGQAYDPTSGRLFIHNFLDRSVTVYEIAAFLRSGRLPEGPAQTLRTVANEQLAAEVLTGKQIFYNASDERMALESYISCASCHLDGGHDGRTLDFHGRGEGFRNTTDLRGRRGTGHGRVHWTANFDEIQDFEHDIRAAFGGTGFMSDADFARANTSLGAKKAGKSAALDALAAYVTSLDATPRSPYRAGDGSMTAVAVRGAEVFKRLDCASCHSGSDFTDSATGATHDVGTIGPNSGNRLGAELTGIDTPTLLGVWATAPYLHDGSAANLEAVFATGPSNGDHGVARGITADDRADLVAFLRQLETGDTNPGQTEPEPVQQQGFHGSPLLIAATGTTRIEAEEYDLGGEGIAYHDVDSTNNGGAYRTDAVDIETTRDAGGGHNVGWIANGEWMEYAINVAAAGTYDVELRVARGSNGGSWLRVVTSDNESGVATVPSTGGWQSWTTVSTRVELSAGPQSLPVYLGGGINFNWLSLTPVAVAGLNGPIQEQNGLVAIELADYDRHEATSEHAWEPIIGLADTAGEALVAAPNLGANLGDSIAGPHLVYHVEFATAGTWYLWLRAWGTSESNNSCHVGLNGQPASFGRWGLGLV
ncbi:MAG: carbohydrate-binding protein [Planctomycetota bacterium]|jgi:cytochrome c peroxidase|nr:carbohydrate-binding protein [Planctomycetota bacterium]